MAKLDIYRAHLRDIFRSSCTRGSKAISLPSYRAWSPKIGSGTEWPSLNPRFFDSKLDSPAEKGNDPRRSCTLRFPSPTYADRQCPKPLRVRAPSPGNLL